MKNSITLIVLIISFQFAKAQDLETIILAADDASLLSQNYLNPAMEGLMYSMNGGWATTAKVHKKFGFDLTIGLNASLVPEEAKSFAFVPGDYTYLSLQNNETELQTIMSEDDAEVMVDVKIPNDNGTYKVVSFTMPGGITEDLPINAVPAPTVQVGFGLPFKTDIKARFVPTQRYDDVEAKLIGFGLQHDLTQYLGVVDKSPLSISVLGAFTNMSVVYDMKDEDATDNVEVVNGEAEFKMNTWTVQALASLDFKLITFYGSAGYNNGKTTAKMKGDYMLTYDVEDNNGNQLGTVNESITDPINLDFESNGMRATLGMRFNLGVFKIFADYTFQNYDTATAGIAFSFR
ncbi:hypothetical protein HNV10_16485 [Winogradskyella litoriviva]|uniref:Outer membrane protein beta-barrel domain-containing protein n=1 Tax=Winogradskyella litoriviva TaxID=1220182 RepID=A0ABX2E8N1_9FLAO|nr:DUF6588 family protein [Winogradskyella litoriviva]NRD24853.1 hypothetical protein [Winogradskyella litoriviva]